MTDPTVPGAAPPPEQAAATPRLVLTGLPPPRPPWRVALRWSLFAALVVVNAGVALLAAAWFHYAHGLPELPSIEGYRPPIITETISADGQIAGEFFEERRKVVPYGRIPRTLVQAFIASEDQRFFEHRGVDWRGTLRAAFTTYVLHHGVKGGSTITQQTAKAILISAEGFKEGTRRNLRRKIRELILASRLERQFTKEQILWLYLNGVYLGHHSYGVQSAAENYYRKNVEDLTLAEAALLAGLPQAPSRYSPFAHPDSARDRRRYVLRRMSEERFITAEERAEAEAQEVSVFGLDDVFRETAPFYVEQVRRQIVERYGNERLLHDGLRVEMAMDLEKQRAAQAAMLKGLMEVDHRQGFYGPVDHVEGAARQAMQARLATAWPEGALAMGDYAVGVVDQVAEKLAVVQVGGQRGLLPLAGMRWARRPNPEVHYNEGQLKRITGVLRPGDVVLVRRVGRRELLQREEKEPERAHEIPEADLLLTLEQEPKLQGALVSIDPHTGEAVAMVGGYDFEASEFNRAFQACRQPGSAFKPVVYSAAIEKLDWSPATILSDAPIVFRDDDNAWKPQNFGQDFKGDVTLRTALVNSMNIPAVKTAEALASRLGSDFLGQWAAQLGLTTPVKRELGSALGSSCVSLWELTGIYATFARLGEKRPVTMVKRVLDREGRTLEDRSRPRDPWVPLSTRLGAAVAEVTRPRARAMEATTAYVLVSLLQEAATVGTGAGARALGKPAAGKTGTTNDSFDTWFMGFTRDLACGVWLGYDLNVTPLGRGETGGRASLPIWLDYMSAALRDRPQPEFEPPEEIVMVRIDPDTGKPVPDDAPGVVEPFKPGTEPIEEAGDAAKPVEVQDLFME
jgi:penicillin-binding protein 1A